MRWRRRGPLLWNKCLINPVIHAGASGVDQSGLGAPTAVTYWVEYTPQDDAFMIFKTYSHGMIVPGSTLSR